MAPSTKKKGGKRPPFEPEKENKVKAFGCFRLVVLPSKPLTKLFGNIAISSCHITVGLEVSRKRQPLPSESIVAPRKRWTHTSSGTVATQLDSDSEELVSDHGTATGKGQHVSKKSKPNTQLLMQTRCFSNNFPCGQPKTMAAQGTVRFGP